MLSAERWIEVTESGHDHEKQGLRLVRELLPNTSPYRAWANFEFKDDQGNWHEVDLLVLARDALHLIELKHYAGQLGGNDRYWERPGHPIQDSPLLLARRKAQRLKSKLVGAAERLLRELGQDPRIARSVVPHVKESVFLHAPNAQTLLPDSAGQGVYGLSPAQVRELGARDYRSTLRPVEELLLAPARNERHMEEGILLDLMERLGAQRRERTAGSWSLIEVVDDADTFQEWSASHERVPIPLDARALRGLKFEELLPPHLAVRTLTARIREPVELF